MNIWIVNEGEPIPQLTGRGRLMRAGMLADFFSEQGHNVTWWFSTFLHYEKRFYKREDVFLDLKKNLHLKMLNVKKAYSKNISLARILYCRLLANKFSKTIKNELKPDIIYCSWPLIELAYQCVKYGKDNNIPVIIDIRDMWPDIFTQPFHGLVKKIVSIVVSILYGRKTKYVMMNASNVISVTQLGLNLAKKYKRNLRNGDEVIPLSFYKNILNVPKLGNGESYLKQKGISREEFNLVFFGSINNRVDNMDFIIKAADHCKNRKIKFIICGDGNALDDCINKTSTLENIQFLGYLNVTEMAWIASASKIGLLCYRNKDDFVDSIPSKFSEYLSYGLPVCTTLFGLSKKLLEENKCGFYCDNVDDFLIKINYYCNNPETLASLSKNALELFHSSFDCEIVYKRLLDQILLLKN